MYGYNYFRAQHQLLPSINAAEELSESESDSEVDTKKKRYRKEKIGFRDRKVYIPLRKKYLRFFYFIFYNFIIIIFFLFLFTTDY